NFFGRAVPAHLVFEVAAYTVGFQIFLLIRRRAGEKSPARVPVEALMWLLVGCVFGALFGSKLLAWIESAPEYWAARHDIRAWFGGKTIVGGLLGGWIGVEIAKKRLGIRGSTGDLFAIPLCLGIAIGRIGCFLTGLSDHTHGIATSLPWAVDFGDGIPRHPTQLYEILFLLLLAIALQIRSRRPHMNGEIFRLFMLSYLAWRFCVEFIKPTWKPIGVSPIQMASVIGAVVAAKQWARLRRKMRAASVDHRHPERSEGSPLGAPSPVGDPSLRSG